MQSYALEIVPDLNMLFSMDPIPTILPAYAVYTPSGYWALKR